MAPVGCVQFSWWWICTLAVLWMKGCYSQNSYDLRLVGGDQPNKGRVEIYLSLQWRTICDNYNWGLDEARVVCRQLGYGDDNVVVRRNAYFGQGTGLTQQIRCSGYATHVSSCFVENTYCSHTDDAGVECGDSVTTYPATNYYYSNSIRLVGGGTPSEGRVEIFYNGQWNTFCDDGWGRDEARVVCSQLGYDSDYAVARGYAYFGQGSGLIQLASCNGFESRLDLCTLTSAYTCYHFEDAGVECGYVPTTNNPYPWPTTYDFYGRTIRLMDGDTPREGRVEIYYNYQWNTICDDTWDLNEAEVVCRQLGYDADGAIARTSAYFGQGSGPIRSIQCNGYESSLNTCSNRPPSSTCYHFEDAGVTCRQNKTSSRVIGVMSFAGVALFLLTIAAMVAVLYTCRKQHKPTPAPREMVPLSTSTPPAPAPDTATTAPLQVLLPV